VGQEIVAVILRREMVNGEEKKFWMPLSSFRTCRLLADQSKYRDSKSFNWSAIVTLESLKMK